LFANPKLEIISQEFGEEGIWLIGNEGSVPVTLFSGISIKLTPAGKLKRTLLKL